ncbi:MAG: hypothetical protein KUG77_28990 [Nannocystaceae bacterium]|nr:hypothetical protein [Nannocystaceae bacterium]
MRQPIMLLALCTSMACSPSGADSTDSGEETEAGGGSTQSTGGGNDASMGATDGSSDTELGTSESSGGETGGQEPVDTVLPPLPELPNVRLRMDGDAANVTFDAVDGAVDYRIYPLPDDDDITIAADGSVVVDNAIYRCSGLREGLYMLEDLLSPAEGWNDNAAGGATVLHSDIHGFVRSDEQAELGHVYQTAARGRIPVYVLGDPDIVGEGGFDCGRPVFGSTRPKLYTTDASERDALVADGWRDDGIGFYIPAQPSASTHPIYEGAFGDQTMLRWVDGPEGDARGSGTELFEVLTEADPDSVPLMRVYVAPYCSRAHDELAVGMAGFTKARSEGDHPLTEVRWAGMTQDTVLVVEALESGCPYQGVLSPGHADAAVESLGEFELNYEAYLTMDDMRSASSTGEVFVNGQYDDAAPPRAIARNFVHASPQLPQMDYFATFPVSEDLFSTFAEPTGNVYGQHFESPDYTFSSYNNSRIFFGAQLGEFRVAYNDIAADVNGKVRLTPKVMGAVNANSFLHVTSEVDVISSGRRYPQIMISDQGAPVQDNLEAGTTLIVQPKDLTPSYLQVQVCDHRTWDVNNQCPQLPTRPTDQAFVAAIPGEKTGVDNALRIDIYLSSERIYLFTDEQPYACVDLPATSFEDGNVYSPPSGPVTVTWGDVLYHSSVDLATGGGPVQGNSYTFHRNHMQITTRRHFDNIGFSSDQPAPEWDEALMPCQGAAQ